MSSPTITYNDILPPNSFVTGVRQDGGEGQPVVLSGNYQPTGGGKPQAMLYRGPLYPTDSNGIFPFLPTFPGQTIVTSTFYGPNTALFDPGLGHGNVRAVGSYQYEESGKGDHGMIYQGPLDGSGTWTQIDVPADVAGGTVANTLAHSTMGDLVVGNYDLAGQPGSGNGFIYNVKSGTFQVLDIGALATLYGIWQNGPKDPAPYTLAGGYKQGHGLNTGLLADYDPATGTLSRVTSLSYEGKPGIVTHFEGISGVPGGYALAATTDAGGAFVHVDRLADGGFGPARWLPAANPASASISTANSILRNHLVGIYHPASGGVQSYVATLAD
ncbi:hypothetical protein UAJ10_14640 [Nitrospirillum sp. BR 11164]|uniref:hypothetical protein n=1 Tax=Nitrospirillum sp. BR 11164 TaxID=3104324 RepID=UPI002AFDE371|nr:hypothetical protein [Nitrospirillum sp. BR 11164]MEA1650244.1 hypothetical protein [Nitrospirillum sp. BR 11164]